MKGGTAPPDSTRLKHSAEGSAESSDSPAGSAEPEKRSAELHQPTASASVVKREVEKTTAPKRELADISNMSSIPPVAEGSVGEELTPCSETEWLSSDDAEPAELLNIKKDQVSPTVPRTKTNLRP